MRIVPETKKVVYLNDDDAFQLLVQVQMVNGRAQPALLVAEVLADVAGQGAAPVQRRIYQPIYPAHYLDKLPPLLGLAGLPGWHDEELSPLSAKRI